MWRVCFAAGNLLNGCVQDSDTHLLRVFFFFFAWVQGLGTWCSLTKLKDLKTEDHNSSTLMNIYNEFIYISNSDNDFGTFEKIK